MERSERENRRRRRLAAIALRVGALALTLLGAERAASAQSAHTMYTGNDCVYETNPARLSTSYSATAGALSGSSLHCPILRTKPSYGHASVEVIFGAPLSSTTVSCVINSTNVVGGGTQGHSQTMTVLVGDDSPSLFVDISLALTSGETSYWSALNDDANAQWRTLSVVCATNGVPLQGYDVLEYP